MFSLKKKVTPSERAVQLLKQLLTPQQWRQWEQYDYFDVQGSEGHWFRINRAGGAQGNIGVYASERSLRVSGYVCVAPLRHIYRPKTDRWDSLPTEDLIIGQYLAIRADERTILDCANPWSGTLPRWARC